jgi:hypothetical protein
MTRSFLRTACPALTAVLTSFAVHADQVLDQEVDATNGLSVLAVFVRQSLAQTFTVGRAGTLSEIDLQLSKATQADGSFTLSILPTSAGVPVSNAPLFSRSYLDQPLPTNADLFRYVAFDIADAKLSVSVGDRLAIALSSSSGTSPDNWIRWAVNRYPSVPTLYASGDQYFTRGDLSAPWQQEVYYKYSSGFRTFVSPAQVVPEPPINVSVFQGVTFTTRKSGSVIDLEIDAAGRNGDWTTAKFIDSSQLNNIGSFSSFAMGGDGSGWAPFNKELNANGCAGGPGEKRACAQGTPVALADDMHFEFTFDDGAALDLASADLKVRFLDENYEKVGSLLSQPIPEPGTCALMLAGLGVVGFAARRRKG